VACHIVWALGRAQGFMLPVTDAAVFVHGDGWRAVRSYLDQWLGVAGTRRDLAAWHSWHCAGTSLALFGLFRLRPRGRFVAGSLNYALDRRRQSCRGPCGFAEPDWPL